METDNVSKREAFWVAAYMKFSGRYHHDEKSYNGEKKLAWGAAAFADAALEEYAARFTKETN